MSEPVEIDPNALSDEGTYTRGEIESLNRNKKVFDLMIDDLTANGTRPPTDNKDKRLTLDILTAQNESIHRDGKRRDDKTKNDQLKSGTADVVAILRTIANNKPEIQDAYKNMSGSDEIIIDAEMSEEVFNKEVETFVPGETGNEVLNLTIEEILNGEGEENE